MQPIIVFLLALFLAVQTSIITKAEHSQSIEAAFLRKGHLWLKNGDSEVQLTYEETVTAPKWSHDGQWISYTKQGELWLYNVARNKHFPTLQKARSCQWSPTQNILAFQVNSGLSAIDLESGDPANCRNIASGVDTFSWMPDGSGFVTSNAAHLQTDGSANVRLFKIAYEGRFSPKQGEEFFQIPKDLSADKIRILPTNDSGLKWSNDEKWLAFVVSPSSAMSLDRSVLCIVSADGKRFAPVAEMVNSETDFQWAPHRELFAYISSDGKMYLENKREPTIKEVMGFKPASLTPKQSVDRSLAWQNDDTLIVSREKEKKSANPAREYSPSALYQINLQTGSQSQITFPSEDFADSHPVYLAKHNQLAWIRSNGEQSEVWIANCDGTGARVWIRDIDDNSAAWMP